jgi:hypothetical protein
MVERETSGVELLRGEVQALQCFYLRSGSLIAMLFCVQ